MALNQQEFAQMGLFVPPEASRGIVQGSPKGEFADYSVVLKDTVGGEFQVEGGRYSFGYPVLSQGIEQASSTEGAKALLDLGVDIGYAPSVCNPGAIDVVDPVPVNPTDLDPDARLTTENASEYFDSLRARTMTRGSSSGAAVVPFYLENVEGFPEAAFGRKIDVDNLLVEVTDLAGSGRGPQASTGRSHGISIGHLRGEPDPSNVFGLETVGFLGARPEVTADFMQALTDKVSPETAFIGSGERRQAIGDGDPERIKRIAVLPSLVGRADSYNLSPHNREAQSAAIDALDSAENVQVVFPEAGPFSPQDTSAYKGLLNVTTATSIAEYQRLLAVTGQEVLTPEQVGNMLYITSQIQGVSQRAIRAGLRTFRNRAQQGRKWAEDLGVDAILKPTLLEPTYYPHGQGYRIVPEEQKRLIKIAEDARDFLKSSSSLNIPARLFSWFALREAMKEQGNEMEGSAWTTIADFDAVSFAVRTNRGRRKPHSVELVIPHNTSDPEKPSVADVFALVGPDGPLRPIMAGL